MHLGGAAARLYWRSFGPALQPLPTATREGVALVAMTMNRERALIALDRNGALVGIAGLRGARGGILSPSAADFLATFGRYRGRLRHAASWLHRAGPETYDLILDGVAVRRHWRGRGVARALVAAAMEEARRLGHPALLVEVEARNLDALAAWQAMGFQSAGRQRLGWPWRARAHVLRKPLQG
ncbi:GNAT family N-acetyltransferase [Paracoccus sp. MBLB3053]|uniref:GNAT family N-acetyltransferase n=1 Tax=Paracoccus aurantius TaxID=3073814 RepID=A0ABU2HPX1_9RHOB|nr:GNAT family N-acetyltransferase [Paracoccus sp. MBLB3053]MDS9467096.1 GNAT family N-acetyltransferase [Paracoccus sp. MBLB3053]